MVFKIVSVHQSIRLALNNVKWLHASFKRNFSRWPHTICVSANAERITATAAGCCPSPNMHSRLQRDAS